MGLVSKIFGGDQYKKAAEAEAEGFQNSIATYKSAENTARADYQPFYEYGRSGVRNLMAAMGGDYSAFRESPGYQFRLAEGNKALDRSAAARGMLMSGSQLKRSMRYNQDYASGEYGNWYNRMAGAANTGLGVANAMANYGLRTAENIGAAQQGVGSARASGYAAKGNIYGSIANKVLDVGGYIAGKKYGG